MFSESVIVLQSSEEEKKVSDKLIKETSPEEVTGLITGALEAA